MNNELKEDRSSKVFTKVTNTISDLVITNILEIFSKLILAEYRVHLFNVHLEYDNDSDIKNTFPSQSKYDVFANFQNEQEKKETYENNLIFKNFLIKEVNELQSELLSLINAVHKMPLMNKLYGDVYQLKLDYQKIKQQCFKKVQKINDIYESGMVNISYYEKSVPTYGHSFNQQRLRFDPHFFLSGLTRYFIQVECQKITVDNYGGGDSQANYDFNFQYLLFPMFSSEKITPKSKNLLNNAFKGMFDGFFNLTNLDNLQSNYACKEGVNISKDMSPKEESSLSNFSDVLVYKDYPAYIFNQDLSEENVNELMEQLYDNYENNYFIDEPLPYLLKNNTTVGGGHQFSLLPYQFVFRTKVLSNSLEKHYCQKHQFTPPQKAKLLARYTGEAVLHHYLNKDRTGYWLNTLLIDYAKEMDSYLNKNNLSKDELMLRGQNIFFQEGDQIYEEYKQLVKALGLTSTGDFTDILYYVNFKKYELFNDTHNIAEGIFDINEMIEHFNWLNDCLILPNFHSIMQLLETNYLEKLGILSSLEISDEKVLDNIDNRIRFNNGIKNFDLSIEDVFNKFDYKINTLSFNSLVCSMFNIEKNNEFSRLLRRKCFPISEFLMVYYPDVNEINVIQSIYKFVYNFFESIVIKDRNLQFEINKINFDDILHNQEVLGVRCQYKFSLLVNDKKKDLSVNSITFKIGEKNPPLYIKGELKVIIDKKDQNVEESIFTDLQLIPNDKVISLLRYWIDMSSILIISFNREPFKCYPLNLLAKINVQCSEVIFSNRI